MTENPQEFYFLFWHTEILDQPVPLKDPGSLPVHTSGRLFQRSWLHVYSADNCDYSRTFRYGNDFGLSNAIFQRTLLGQVDNNGRAARSLLHVRRSNVDIQVN